MAAVWTRPVESGVNQIQTSGKGKALFTSKDMPGLIPDCWWRRRNRSPPTAILSAIKAWYDAEKFIRDNPDEAAKIMSKVAE
jgi:NitT/TauT family transport system substrate-binding protein